MVGHQCISIRTFTIYTKKKLPDPLRCNTYSQLHKLNTPRARKIDFPYIPHKTQLHFAWSYFNNIRICTRIRFHTQIVLTLTYDRWHRINNILILLSNNPAFRWSPPNICTNTAQPINSTIFTYTLYYDVWFLIYIYVTIVKLRRISTISSLLSSFISSNFFNTLAWISYVMLNSHKQHRATIIWKWRKSTV